MTAPACAQLNLPVVDTRLGRIKGSHCSDAPRIAQYTAIPFARPPVGDLRWAVPQPYTTPYPPEGLDGSKPLEKGRICPQKIGNVVRVDGVTHTRERPVRPTPEQPPKPPALHRHCIGTASALHRHRLATWWECVLASGCGSVRNTGGPRLRATGMLWEPATHATGTHTPLRLRATNPVLEKLSTGTATLSYADCAA